MPELRGASSAAPGRPWRQRMPAKGRPPARLEERGCRWRKTRADGIYGAAVASGPRPASHRANGEANTSSCRFSRNPSRPSRGHRRPGRKAPCSSRPHVGRPALGDRCVPVVTAAPNTSSSAPGYHHPLGTARGGLGPVPGRGGGALLKGAVVLSDAEIAARPLTSRTFGPLHVRSHWLAVNPVAPDLGTVKALKCSGMENVGSWRNRHVGGSVASRERSISIASRSTGTGRYRR